MIKNTNRKQVIHCNLSEICVSVLHNPGIYVLIHAPMSCSNIVYNSIINNIRRISLKFKRKIANPSEKIFVTNISDKEAIFGGEKLLKRCLSQIIENKHPECLIVVTGCTASVIGDDVASICLEAEMEYLLPVIYIPGAGFMSNQDQEGLLLSSKYIYQYVADNTVPKNSSKAVLFGINEFLQTEEQKNEILRLFRYFGIKNIVFAPCGMAMEEFENLNGVSLAIVHSLTYKKLMAYREFGKQFADYLNISLVDEPLPFTVQATFKYLTYLGEITGQKEAAIRAIQQEKHYWEEERSTFNTKLSCRKYILAIGQPFRVNNPLDLLYLLEEVGMEIIQIVYLNSLTEKEILEFKELFSSHNISISMIKENSGKISNDADVFITSDYRKNFSRQVCIKRKRIGIGGCVHLLQCIVDLLEQGRWLKYE